MQRRVFSLSLLATAIACRGKGGGDGGGVEGDSSTAPRFTGKTLDDEYVALDDFRGKVVLLNVWATWCAPCRKELPELVRLQKDYADQGFTVLGVSIDAQRDHLKVKRMATQYQLNYPTIFDPGASAVNTFNVKGYPTSILIGRGGQLRWRRDGLIRPGDQEVAAQLKAALSAP